MRVGDSKNLFHFTGTRSSMVELTRRSVLATALLSPLAAYA
jgi:hypothetical protein